MLSRRSFLLGTVGLAGSAAALGEARHARAAGAARTFTFGRSTFTLIDRNVFFPSTSSGM